MCFIRFLFILNAFVYLITFENRLGTAVWNSGNPDRTQIENVFTQKSHHDSAFTGFSPCPRQIVGTVDVNIDFIKNSRLALTVYNQNVLNQIKSFHHITALYPFISILQKNNIWHQSSDDDPHQAC
jgi:hypothetical protein